MSNLQNALKELREKRSRARMEIEKLDQIISGIESLNGRGVAVPSKTAQPKRIISAASRRKMALAQKARWAGLRKKSQPMVAKSTGSAPAKRKISAVGRKKMAEAFTCTLGGVPGREEESGLVAWAACCKYAAGFCV
jgi:hypothetical protein